MKEENKMNFFGNQGINDKFGMEEEQIDFTGLGKFMLFRKAFPTSSLRLIKDFHSRAEALIWMQENGTEYFSTYELVEGTDIGLKVEFFPGKCLKGSRV